MGSIYDNKAWSLVDPRSRKCLISVLEGVVPGTEVHPSPDYPIEPEDQLKGIEDICLGAGLYFRRSGCQDADYDCIDVSYDRWLLEYALGDDVSMLVIEPVFQKMGRGLSEQDRADLAETIRLGRFYGYPECCVESFAEGIAKIGDEKSQKRYCLYKDAYSRRHSDWFHRNRAAFWGAFLEHVPCSASCDGSARLAGRIWAAVNMVDMGLSNLLFKEQLGLLDEYANTPNEKL